MFLLIGLDLILDTLFVKDLSNHKPLAWINKQYSVIGGGQHIALVSNL